MNGKPSIPFRLRLNRGLHLGSCALMIALITGCASVPAPQADPATEMPASKRSLASFAEPQNQQACFDRENEPYTTVVDAHFHPKPFGGPAMSPPELFDYFGEMGVRFVTYMGIGQLLDMGSGCVYYLDCPGVAARPSVKNDFLNGMEVEMYSHDDLHITLSMTFMDLANPDSIVDTIAMYDKEYPGMFTWAGEVNVVKQALMGNHHQAVTTKNIDDWAPFMEILRERNIPITLHSDLGNNADPTKYLYLMEHVLHQYPDNPIVWAHMGLSKELSTMSPEQHVSIMSRLLDEYPNLMLDISWDVLYNSYHQWGGIFIPFFNDYSTRILAGSDFVAAGYKEYQQYAKELEITSRALRFLDNEAFRNIALGENYFRLLDLDYTAPAVCPDSGPATVAQSN